MKKFFIVMLVLVLALTAVIALAAGKTGDAAEEPAAEESAAAPEETAAEEPAAAPEIQRLDYDAIHALHDGGEVIMTAAGRDITWDEYFSVLRYNGLQIEDYFAQMASYYGESAAWDGSIGDGSGNTYADYPTYVAENTLVQFAVAEKLAADKNVTLSEEHQKALEPENLAVEALGEGAGVAELEAALDEQLHMTLQDYQNMARVNNLYLDIRDAMYGKDGELADEADIIAHLEDAGYVSANHILFMTIDPSTGEALEESAAAEKKADADKIYAELSAITDSEKLVERFKELKAEYCEDGGAAIFPDGYTYTPGTMVAVFEDTVNGLEVYGLSEPVQSDYGYHIILRMPLGTENLLYSSSGEPDTARMQYVRDSFSAELAKVTQENPAVYAEDFEPVNLLDYIK